MAVANHQYYQHYHGRTLGWFVGLQILGGLVAGGLAWAAWQFTASGLSVVFVTGSAVIVVNVLLSFLLLRIAAKPHQLLAQAVAHVSADPVLTPPPELAPADDTSGLKNMVQTVYGLAVGENSQHVTQSVSSVDGVLQALTADAPCGLIAFDKQGSILYANQLAPVRTRPDGAQEITLLFDQGDSLIKWFQQSEANKVRDTHTWQRIADALPGEEKRRIFDVAAYYQKDNPAGVAVILVAFDRTGNYSTDQEDMDFIALAAHELRGPITVIRGYLDVIKNDLGANFNADQQELFDRLQVSSERLAGYVNNILNVSRYDRKQFQIHLHQENLMDILKSLAPDLGLRARTQRRKLIFRIPAGLPTIAADRSSLGEVITNLIDNGIKYSHENGEVIITAMPKDGDLIELTVTDQGIGMPESVVGGLFNKFYRSHRSRQRVGGTGLGLYICKAIVDSHGGSIWVRSKEGEGSTFGFTVPTYASVAARLQAGGGQNADIVQRPEGWIKNHAMYRR